MAEKSEKKDNKQADSKILTDVLKADRVSEEIGIRKCIQCGLCSSGCPAARYSDFSPRKIINAVLQGYLDILKDEIIWNCFSCYTCHMRCPRGNSPITIIQVLKQLSLEQGFNKNKFQDFLAYGDSFLEIGAGSYSKEMVEKLYEDWGEDWLEIRLNNETVRKQLGLQPSLLPKEARNEINRILELSGFKERLKKLKETGE